MVSLHSIKTVIPAVAFICFMILLIVFLYSKKTKERILYSRFLISMSLWCLGSLFMRLQLFDRVLLWNKLMCAGIICTSVIFYHFSLVFSKCKINKKNLFINYSIALFLQIVNISGKIVTEAEIKEEGLSYVMGWGAYILALWSIYLFTLSMIRILEQVKKENIPLQKLILIIVGMTATVIGALLNFFSDSIGRYPVDIALNTFNAMCIFYSIYRHRFLGTRLIVRKFINVMTFTIIQISVFYLCIMVLRVLKVKMSVSAVFSSSTVVIINTLFHDRIKARVGEIIDVLLYRDKISEKSALREYTENLISCLDISEITEHVIEVINKIIQPEKIVIFLEQSENTSFKIISVSDENNININMNITNKHPLIKWFKDNSVLTYNDLSTNPYFNSLWSSEKEELEKLNLELFFPIKLRGRVLGMVAVGDKYDSTPYRKDDIDNLLTIVNGAAPTFENARNYHKAKEQAITDGLTGLYNHRYFYHVIDKVIDYESYSAISVVMFDVDYFKFYNDIYGHAAGDIILNKIAKVIKNNIKERDIACRYGGEEFAVILIDKDEKEALAFAERVRIEVQNMAANRDGVNPLVSVSCGISSYPYNNISKNDLLEKADKAMYVAKNVGKNRSKLYELEMECKEFIREEEDIMLASMYAIAEATGFKDKYTLVHSQNVSRYGVMLAEALGYDEEKVEVIRKAGLLHDIGKIGIPDRILTKDEELTEEERSIMNKHVELSVEIFKHIPALMKIIPSVLCHHERYDGLGYPRGVKGENIPEEARCLAVVNAYEAMTSYRPNKNALSMEEALVEIEDNKGKQFDPYIAEVFIKLVRERREEFESGIVYMV